MFRNALGHAPRVDEDQSRRVLADQRFELAVDLFPDVAGHHRFERCVGQFEREVAFARVAGCRRSCRRGHVLSSSPRSRDPVTSMRKDQALGPRFRADDGRGWRRSRQAQHSAATRPATPSRTSRPPRSAFRRRRKPDAGHARPAERIEPFERQREMTPALVRRNRVRFVDDDRAHGRQHAPARLRAEQDVERFGRRDDDMRRALAHLVALGLRRVARAHERANLDVGAAKPAAARRGCPRSALRG